MPTCKIGGKKRVRELMVKATNDSSSQHIRRISKGNGRNELRQEKRVDNNNYQTHGSFNLHRSEPRNREAVKKSILAGLL